jgi:hypothetical protein
VKSKLYKSLIAVFLFATALTFFGTTYEAKAREISITIYTGSGRSCSGFGICKIVIIIDLRAAQPDGTDNAVLVKGDAEIKGDYLTVTLKDKLKDEMRNPDGKYIFPIKKDIKIKGEDAKSFGYKSFKLEKGDYELTENQLKIPISDLKKFGTKD